MRQWFIDGEKLLKTKAISYMSIEQCDHITSNVNEEALLSFVEEPTRSKIQGYHPWNFFFKNHSRGNRC